MKDIRVKKAGKQFAEDVLGILVSPAELSGRGKLRRSSGAVTLGDVENRLGISLKSRLKKMGFEARSGQSAIITPASKGGPLAFVFLGWDKEHASTEDIQKLAATLHSGAKKSGARTVGFSGGTVKISQPDFLESFVPAFTLTGYEFNRYRKKAKEKTPGVTSLSVYSSHALSSTSLGLARSIQRGVARARDLVNMPACDCTPRYMASECRRLARSSKITVQVFDRRRLEAMGARALLGVGKGSKEPPFLIKLTIPSRRKRKKVISLVGKGITFDTGGYSVKTSSGMMTMKCDMSGAAAVIGAIDALSTLSTPHEIRAYIPVAENMIDGNATRPGDIVKAMNGKTIEVLNTDAEGRLILADALSLATKEKSDVIVDLATLTGACMAALGDDYAGLFSNDDRLAESLLGASVASGEPLWRLPLIEAYREQLKSSVADLKNIGDGLGGAITAALFLSEFVGDTTWAHLDIAGPAFIKSAKAHRTVGGTGYGVETLVRWVLSL